MADNYLQFSEVIPRLTREEEAWLRSQFERIYVFGEQEHPEGQLPEHLDPKDADWIGVRGLRDAEDQTEDDEFLGFQHEFHDADDRNDWGRYLWLFAEENGNPGRVVHVVQKFLRQFREQECWSLTYAMTCSKPRVGEFGGGAVFVTANTALWNDSYQFVDDQHKAFGDMNRTEHVLETANPEGVPRQPDQAVAVSSDPSLELWIRILAPGGKDLGCSPIQEQNGKIMLLDGPYGLLNWVGAPRDFKAPASNDNAGKECDRVLNALLAQMTPIVGSKAEFEGYYASIVEGDPYPFHIWIYDDDSGKKLRWYDSGEQAATLEEAKEFIHNEVGARCKVVDVRTGNVVFRKLTQG